MSVSLTRFATRAIVLDIEGTTTPIDFVYNILFPYARSHAAPFLERAWGTESCRAAVELLRQERAVDGDVLPLHGSLDAFTPADALGYVQWLMERDRKSPGLKALQGLIWREGFEAGELRGHVYRDVLPAFRRWRALGLDLYIYSSGSVLAQRLLFGSTPAGDLTVYLKGYFDTEVGPKARSESYRRIVERLGVAPGVVLFVSDVVAELDAAVEAGLRTTLCVRGDAAPAAVAHPVIRTFDEIVE